jgi:hypothetical protein
MEREVWAILIVCLLAFGALVYGLIRFMSFLLVIRNRIKEHGEEDFERRDN